VRHFIERQSMEYAGSDCQQQFRGIIPGNRIVASLSLACTEQGIFMPESYSEVSSMFTEVTWLLERCEASGKKETWP
jgi:hypothetical protein